MIDHGDGKTGQAYREAQFEKDAELGRMVRELAKYEPEIAKSRGPAVFFRVSYFVGESGARAWRSVNAPTLDAAVAEALKRAGGGR